MASKFKILSIRRADVVDLKDSNDMEKYLNARGYYSVPRDMWHNLDKETQEQIKKYNGNLRKSLERKLDVTVISMGRIG